MQVSVEDRDGLERCMTVRVPADRIEQEVDLKLTKVGRQAKLKGFRPGKAPLKVIKQHYGGQVRQEVLQEMLELGYTQGIEKEKLRPAAMPQFESKSADEGQDFVFSATFEIYPEFEVGGIDQISIEQAETEITDADLGEMTETLRKQSASWTTAERKSKTGDRVTIDFEGTHNNEPLEGGKGADVPIVIGQGQMLPDFEKGVTGIVAGDETSFKVTFPADYHATELANETVTFAATCKKVEEEVLPEVDADFFKLFGIEDGSLEDFRNQVRENMQREASARIKANVKQQAMEQLLEANAITLPAALVDREAQNLRGEAMRQMGITDESDPRLPPLDTYNETAGQRVRLGLLIGSLIEDQGIEVDRERVTAKVVDLCASYDNPEEIQKMYFQNPQLLSQVDGMVIEEQVVEWLIDQGTVTIKKIPFSELMQAG